MNTPGVVRVAAFATRAVSSKPVRRMSTGRRILTSRPTS
jgi:hypothetical protein